MLDQHENETNIARCNCEGCKEIEWLGQCLDSGLKTMDEAKNLKVVVRKKPSEITKEEFLKLPKHLNLEQKAKILNISKTTLIKLRQKWGYTRSNIEITKADFLALPIELPLYEKAKMLGVDPGNLSRMRKEWGLGKKEITKEEYLSLPKELTQKQKARKLRIHSDTLRKLLRGWDLL